MALRASLAMASLALAALTGGGFFLACSNGGNQGATGTPGADGGEDGSSCVVFAPPTSFDAGAPSVSFASDVVPIFVASCSFPSCHGSTTAPQGGVYLGASAGQVYANLVGVPSTELVSMDRVKAGDPANSFLLHRVDGDACSLAGCTSAACTELMPQGGPALEEAKLLAIRAWIIQGALSDVSTDAGGSEAGSSDTDADASGD